MDSIPVIVVTARVPRAVNWRGVTTVSPADYAVTFMKANGTPDTVPVPVVKGLDK